jgi:hypothetical protein
MALKLLQPGLQPLGQFDGLDTEVLTLKGGEVVTLTSVVVGSATDLSAADASDGYITPNKRPVVTRSLLSGSRPLFLADDGISGYGTLFGVVVGGTVGQTSFGPNSVVPSTAQLGPHTATGSGKVTLWHGQGLYAVSLDACDTAATGLVPTNGAMTAGKALTFTATGLLTPVGASAAVGGAPVVGTFVDFETNGSLVTTSNKMVSSLATATYSFAVFYFNPPLA